MAAAGPREGFWRRPPSYLNTTPASSTENGHRHIDKSPSDPSALPARIEESGLGDIEGQIRWRWNRETGQRPEVFSFAEVVFPHQRDKVLIGTPGWELKYGMGLVRGFRWGTMTDWAPEVGVVFSFDRNR